MKPKLQAEPFASPEEKRFYGELGYRMMVKRKEKGWSQDYLGLQVGVRGQQICKYEDGKDRIKSHILFRAAEVLGVSVSILCGEDETKERPHYDKKILTVAAEIVSLDPEVRKQLYTLARTLNQSGQDIRDDTQNLAIRS